MLNDDQVQLGTIETQLKRFFTSLVEGQRVAIRRALADAYEVGRKTVINSTDYIYGYNLGYQAGYEAGQRDQRKEG